MHILTRTTVFARSDTVATIYFIARVRAVFIRERHLLISVAAREAILRETVNIIDTTDLGDSGPFGNIEEDLNLFWTVYRVLAIENES